MTFLDESSIWPRDISDNHTFLVKAVEDIARAIRKKEVRLPPCVYRYDIVLPEFDAASEDDRIAVADIINTNVKRSYVEILEEIVYSETFEKHIVFKNAHVDRKQWSTAADIIQISKNVPVENVTNAIAITAAIFSGVARGTISALHRRIGGTEFHPLPADRLNLDDDEIIKARLALGQIDIGNACSLDPQGTSHIFLEHTSFEKWKNNGGRRSAELKIAHHKLIRLAESHPNGFPKHLVKNKLMDKEYTGFVFDDKERAKLWDGLPDKPFKLPGIRPDTPEMGST